MTQRTFIRGLIRHTGYALTTLAILLLAIEALVPAFSTPYLNPYLLIMIGVGCAIVGGWDSVARRMSRWAVGIGVGGFLIILFNAQDLSQTGANAWLELAVILIVLLFLGSSVYPESYE